MLGGNKRCKMTYCTGDQCQHSNRNIIIHIVPGGAEPFGISFRSPPLRLNQVAEDRILPRLALVASHCLPTRSAKSLIKTKKNTLILMSRWMNLRSSTSHLTTLLIFSVSFTIPPSPYERGTMPRALCMHQQTQENSIVVIVDIDFTEKL